MIHRPIGAGLLTAGLLSSLMAGTFVAGCATSSGGGGGSGMSVVFDDLRWESDSIPQIGRCRECGGQGYSPALRVSGIPAEATHLVVSFQDLSSYNLGDISNHGAFRVATFGATEVEIPGIAERTTILPEGISIERDHGSGHVPGVGYLAPCACDGNHQYRLLVEALDPAGNALARDRLEMGSCCLQGP